MNGSQDTAPLDPDIFPLLLFHYNNYMPMEESSDVDEPDHDNEQDADDASYKSDGDDEPEEAEKSHRVESAEEANDSLFLYSINTMQEPQCRGLDDLESHFYWVTPQGWLLMRHHDSRETFLGNPSTRERISLPSGQGDFLEENTTRCLLSHAPTDPNCVVLVINCRDTVLWYCSPAAGAQWFEHRYESWRLDESHSVVVGDMRRLTTFGGVFYADLFHTVVKLQFSPHPTFTVTPVGVRSLPLHSCTDFQLLESCGELFRVSFGQQCFVDELLHVGVERLDVAHMAWVKVHTLGDRVFLVNSRYFGASLSAQVAGLKPNCIYFLRHGDKGLYIYNMERGTTTLHNPGRHLQDDVAAEILLIPAA
ncbi:F-box protein [Hordeum vulgare]|nr:F-box protein [Hordeum vulgare]